MIVLEFRNEDFSRIEIVSFSGRSKQDNICIYPVLGSDSNYSINGEIEKSGIAIREDGIEVPVTMPHSTSYNIE